MRACPPTGIRSAACAVAVLLGLFTACTAPATRTDRADVERTAGGPFLRVLGTAQDGGFPHASCDCDRCERAREEPSLRRGIASLALVLPGEGSVFLFDATPDVREQLHAVRAFGGERAGRVDRAPVDGVFLTHAHIGHYLGLAFFGFEAVHTRGLPVYCTAPLADFLRGNAPWDQLVRLENIRLNQIEAGAPVELGAGVRVTAIRVPHRDEYADTVGFRIAGPRRTVLYIPDTDGWDAWHPPVTDVLEGVDLAIVDGTFYSADELPGRDVSSIGHPLIRDSMDLLEPRVREGSLEVRFTHLNHSNPALVPDGAARREIRDRGFAVLDDGTDVSI